MHDAAEKREKQKNQVYKTQKGECGHQELGGEDAGEFVLNGTNSVGEERKPWRWMVTMAVQCECA